ncbi:hypothetical protein EDB19DRAFT_1250030 [Suillus lakei]|nr:hypothetical protein EDB19DRAFT_1250030 [Suillus lakei]
MMVRTAESTVGHRCTTCFIRNMEHAACMLDYIKASPLLRPWRLPEVRYHLAKILGEGAIHFHSWRSQGAQRHQQRMIMNPAFGPAQVCTLHQQIDQAFKLCLADI